MVRTSLQIAYPEIAAEWHPMKNGELLPSQVGYGSSQKVWWLGTCGHEWQAKISNRVFDNNKCPYCSGRYPIVGENDLATTDPEVAAEWHPTKNGDLTPHDVKRSTEKKIWWLGTCGHEWTANIGSRTGKQNTGCPYCSNQKVLIGYNDLQFKYPEIAMEWHPTKNQFRPTEVVYGSSKKAWWLCDVCGHEWSTHIVSRTRNGYPITGCPQCNSGTSTSLPEQAILYYLENAVGEVKHRTCDEIGMELDIFIPSMNVAIEYDGSYWHKNKYHADKMKAELCNANRIRLIHIREKGLSQIDEEEIIWRDGFDDESLNDVLTQLFRWLGVEIDVNISRDKLKIYTRYKYDKKQNSLEVKNPQLAAEWHPTKNGDLKPIHVNVRTSIKVWWLGKCGHEWESTISSRTGERNIGCPYCSNVKVLSGINDLLTTHPYAFDDWDYELNKITPSEVTYGSGKKIFRRCKNNHSWMSLVKDMINGRGCPYCANKIVLKGFNDMATTHPNIAAEWHPIDNGTLLPSDVIAGSTKKVRWLGKCGHEWEASIYARTSGRSGCPYCGNKAIIKGFNDLATTHPKIAAEWHPTKNGKLMPTDITFGSNKKVWWFGVCGHEWDAPVAKRTGENANCPFCSGRRLLVGFNDLATEHPELVVEWHPIKNGNLTPVDVTKASSKKVWWKCSKGHEWEAKISNRRWGNDCPYCAGQKLISGENDLATINPNLAAEWHPTKNGELMPNAVMAKTDQKVWWLGECGHEWQSKICNRSNGNGCPFCARKKKHKISGFW